MKTRTSLIFLAIMILSPSAFAQETCPNMLLPNLMVGEMGRVVDGVTGLHVRTEPNTDSSEIARMGGGDNFTVIDGPVCADGYVWWQLQFDSTTGWAAQGEDQTAWLEARFDTARIRLPSSKIVVTSDNHLVRFSINYGTDGREVYGYSICQLPDCFEPTQIPLIMRDEPGPYTIYWAATLDADGNPVFAIISHSPITLDLIRCHDPLCAETTTATVFDIDSPGHHGAIINLELALTAQGNPVIGFVDYLLPPDVGRLQFGCEPDACMAILRLAICEDPVCSVVRTVDIDDLNYEWDYDHHFRLNLGAGDRPVVSYVDSQQHGDSDDVFPKNELFLASCNTALCDKLTRTHIDRGAGMGLSLGVNAEGFPVLIYYQGGDNKIAIHAAVCSSVDCSTPVISSLIEQSGILPETPLMFTPQGYPMIAYTTDQRDAQLQLAVCHDHACTGRDIRTLDPRRGRIWRIASTQDAHDNPILEFRNRSFDDGDRLLLCEGPTCETYFTVPVGWIPEADPDIPTHFPASAN